MALASALISSLAVVAFLRSRAEAPSLEIQAVTFDWGGVEAMERAAPGIDPLEADGSARFPPSRLVRRSFDEREAEGLFGLSKMTIDVFDPAVGFRPRPGFRARLPWVEHPQGGYWRTHNSLGLRGVEEPSPDRPDLRVLVVGDSHSDGVCDDTESYSARLQGLLRERHPSSEIEVLNGSRGGYSILQYLGTIERLLPLSPDVVVIGIYGGNDFDEGLTLHHFFRGTARPSAAPFARLRDKAAKRFRYSFAQALNSLKYFSYWPDQIDPALQAAREACTEIQVVCLRNSIQPVFAYIPPFTDVEPGRHDRLADSCADLELPEGALGIIDRMADSLLAFLEQQGAEVIDLRPAFRASPVQLYWSSDCHINLDGQALVAHELLDGFDWEPWIARKVVRTGARPSESAQRAPGPSSADRSREDHRLLFEIDLPAREKALTPLERAPLAPFEDFAAATVRTWPQARFDPARWVSWTPDFSGVVQGPAGSRVDLETDSAGCRRLPSTDSGPSSASVLVCGDENVACVARAGDGLAGALQMELSELVAGRVIACVDASAPGQFPDAYAATFDALSARDTAALVVAFDPRTDFAETSRARRGPRAEQARSARARPAKGALPAAKRQIVRHALDVLCELQGRCRKHGCSLVVVMLPASDAEAASSVQRRMAAELVAALRARSVRVADAQMLVTDGGSPPRDPSTGLVVPAIQRRAARAVAIELANAFASQR